MMPTLTIAIEGPDSGRALEEFLALPGLEGEWRRGGEEAEREIGVLVAVGAVVAIAGGVAQVVSSILDWRDRWLRARQSSRLSVVIEDARGNRLALNAATPEEIAAALRTLAPPRT